jgi:DNA repair protein RadC
MVSKFMLKDWPVDERPRERLVKQGPEALSDAELLAIILRTGSRNQSVMQLARSVLSKYKLSKLSQIRVTELINFEGINSAKACQLVACFELAKRVNSIKDSKRKALDSSEDVAKLLIPEMRFLKKEHFVGLYLDSRNCLLKKEVVSIGSLNASLVHPRELYKTAILESAHCVIISHNHPSGNPKPSKDDVTLTKSIVKAGKIIGIPLLDHIIIGNNCYVSMAEAGIVKF